jgi:predicted lipid-binding transport protein (Tim44 family)
VAGSPVWRGLDDIVARDPGFDPREFLEGAKAAYEMIITAFAKGDQPVLRDLLAKDVFESFVAAIDDRNARGETVDTTFVALDKAEFSEIQLRDSTANIAVKFNSQLITATRKADGAVIDGNPDKPVDMVDVWTFSRDLSSRDPNWRLVATEAGR